MKIYPKQNCLLLPLKSLKQVDCNNIFSADSRFAPSQWETSLQSNAVSHWLGPNLESALTLVKNEQPLVSQLCIRRLSIQSHRTYNFTEQGMTGMPPFRQWLVSWQQELRMTHNWWLKFARQDVLVDYSVTNQGQKLRFSQAMVED